MKQATTNRMKLTLAWLRYQYQLQLVEDESFDNSGKGIITPHTESYWVLNQDCITQLFTTHIQTTSSHHTYHGKLERWGELGSITSDPLYASFEQAYTEFLRPLLKEYKYLNGSAKDFEQSLAEGKGGGMGLPCLIREIYERAMDYAAKKGLVQEYHEAKKVYEQALAAYPVEVDAD